MIYNEFGLFLKFIHDEGYVSPKRMGLYKTDKPVIVPANTYGISVCLNSVGEDRLNVIYGQAIQDDSFIVIVEAFSNTIIRYADIAYDEKIHNFTKSRLGGYPTLKDLSDRFTKIREGFQMMEELIK